MGRAKMKLFALIAATASAFGPFDQCSGDGVSTGAEFTADPFTWVGADLGKPKLHGSKSMKMLINMNGLKNFGGNQLNYIGMSIWSRKKCGQDFIDKVADGTVQFDILDKFGHVSEETTTSSLGNSKKDQFHLLLHGIDQVDFGNKDVEACLIGGMVGWMPADSIDASVDYTCMAGWSKRLWNKSQ